MHDFVIKRADALRQRWILIFTSNRIYRWCLSPKADCYIAKNALFECLACLKWSRHWKASFKLHFEIFKKMRKMISRFENEIFRWIMNILKQWCLNYFQHDQMIWFIPNLGFIFFVWISTAKKNVAFENLCFFHVLCCQKIDLGVSDRNFRVGEDQIQMWYLMSFILIFLIFSELINWITSSELKMKAHLNFATKI